MLGLQELFLPNLRTRPMKSWRQSVSRIVFSVLICESMVLSVVAAERPVKVYILSGQSNMVGIGQVTGGGTRWGAEFLDPTVSVYPGDYDPDTDYEELDPIKTLEG